MGFRALPLATLLGALCASGMAAGSESDYGSPLSLPGNGIPLPAKPTAAASTSKPASVQNSAYSLPAPIVQPLPQRWQLHRDALLHEELANWAAQAGWQLRWEPGVTWQVAADSSFSGEFPDAIASVIENLFLEGRPVRLVLWEGNKVAEVVSHEVR
jgi:hypothetical protein